MKICKKFNRLRKKTGYFKLNIKRNKISSMRCKKIN
nr:MAG TPA: hypothetical protein [Bacteriophage sp.]